VAPTLQANRKLRRVRPVRSHRKISRPLAAVLGVALAALLLLPALAAARTTLVDRHGKPIHGKRARWLKQSRMPLVSGRIKLITAGCPGRPKFSGCVYSRRPRTLYVRPGATNPKSVVYHELGHVFDLLLLRHRDRRAFKRVLGLKGRGWFAGTGPPGELFAEAYALCSRFGMKRPAASKLGWTRSVYGYRPTRKQHHAVCLLIVRAGAPKRRGAKPQPPPNAPPVFEQKPPQPPSKQPGNPPLLPGVPLPPLPVPVTLGF
jgi:hypothetical protein